ncbi:hypothetical protein [Nocardioides jishulii]|uniref:Uncharacterized protein n=1 Tax=Nocardioides jishulii TaxID=2575440 RepID=A0A4U2YR14_9ACTN|nr:hypothetical protein [Nocardioides jishulii]QCX26397.1 hypothetical protein FCL41_01690 [Nocardioides jishulii]TKI63798.1 hypothetical protein FC770_01015 [Nocardioides jishulii]
MPTADDFRALARSSPWRCSTAHFTRRGAGAPDVEAWLERPGTMTVRDERGTHRWVNNRQAEIPAQVLRAAGRMPETYTDEDVVRAHLEAPVSWARDVTPITRDDGLVLVRPDDDSWPGARHPYLEVDDPMYDNYLWVAMLDPRELARGVEVSDVREVQHHGRTAWAARCVPTESYDPRCGCCELLWSEVSERLEAEAGGPEPDPEAVYPEAYDVVLDHATGFVVQLTPLGESSRADLAFDVEIPSAT